MAKSTARKKAEPTVKSVTVEIKTTGNHSAYLDYVLGQMPKMYSAGVQQFTNEEDESHSGYRIEVMVDQEGNEFFACRYLANLATEIRMLDEGNVKVTEIPVTAELESAE